MNESNATLIPAPVPKGQTPLIFHGLDEVLKLGTVLAQSGFFSDAKTAAQAVVKVLAGRELGFATIASMVGVHIIEGKPSVGAHLMASMIKRSGKYDYRILRCDREECELEFMERRADKWETVGKTGMTFKEAVDTGLAIGKDGKTVKSNWHRSADDMLFARAISKGYRRYCPDLTGGVLVYDPDELDGETAPALPSPAPENDNRSLRIDALDSLAQRAVAAGMPDVAVEVGRAAGMVAAAPPTTEAPRPNPEAPPPVAGPLTEQEVDELTAIARKPQLPHRARPLSMGQMKAILAALGVPVLEKAPREKLDWLTKAITTGLAPTPQVDRIAALVTELQLKWPDFRARLITRFGVGTIAHLLPAQADQVEQGLKAEKAKRQQPAEQLQTTAPA